MATIETIATIATMARPALSADSVFCGQSSHHFAGALRGAAVSDAVLKSPLG